MRVSIASDYAVLDCGKKGHFYFGYEVTRGGTLVEDYTDGDWCFEFKKNGEVVATIPQPRLGMDEGLDMGEYLLAGIGKLVDQGLLKT